MKWEIRPLEGAGPLAFGMEEERVNSVLHTANESVQRRAEGDGSYSLHRGVANPICYFTPKGKLKGIGLTHHVQNVFIEHNDLFGSAAKDIMLVLQRLNGGSAKYAFWKVLFENISILISGFYFGDSKFYPSVVNDRNDERGIGIFVKDEFAEVVSHFNNFTLK